MAGAGCLVSGDCGEAVKLELVRPRLPGQPAGPQANQPSHHHSTSTVLYSTPSSTLRKTGLSTEYGERTVKALPQSHGIKHCTAL